MKKLNFFKNVDSIIFDFVYLIVLINLSSDLPVTSTLAPLFIKGV